MLYDEGHGISIRMVSRTGEQRVPDSGSDLHKDARAIWQAAVDAAQPGELIRAAFSDSGPAVLESLKTARRILVVGAGKAGAAMSAAVEDVLADRLDRIEGVVNVPAESVRTLRAIRLHAARAAGSNHPTTDGVAGACQILGLASQAAPDDVALCLLSGGGSALLPAPVEGVTLEDKQQVTRLLHACGATINEMNAVRKHLSLIKGGRLVQAFTGRAMFSLIISDVIGDPLDVIASGPTAADPTTFADALAVLKKYHLTTDARERGRQLPTSVLRYLEQGAAGEKPETLKILPPHVHNYVIGNNAKSLAAARLKAEELGYRVLNLGSFIEGDTRQVATVMAGVVRSIRAHNQPLPPPVCLLSGGETTVTLAQDHGLGGRNQEFVLASAIQLGRDGLRNVVVLSGGTDGEDGPTDAAGAVADGQTLWKAESLGLAPDSFLNRNDAYPFFEATGGLLKTGLTHTNVMDARVILIR
jgi:hydroxypyruvate reductase/glycerate 2-kinase